MRPKIRAILHDIFAIMCGVGLISHLGTLLAWMVLIELWLPIPDWSLWLVEGGLIFGFAGLVGALCTTRYVAGDGHFRFWFESLNYIHSTEKASDKCC